MADTNVVITRWQGGMAFESDNPSGKTLRIDAGPENGGEGKGLRPKALMLSALAGCSGLDVASLIEKMKLEVEDFYMETSATLTDEHPRWYDTVNIIYVFKGKNLNKAKLQKAVDLSVEKYCGVMEMFRRFTTVQVQVQVQESSSKN